MKTGIRILPAALLGLLLLASLQSRREQHRRESAASPSVPVVKITRPLSALERSGSRALLVVGPGSQAQVISRILEANSPSTRDQALALLGAIPELPSSLRQEACEQALLRLDDEIYHPAFEMLVADDSESELRQLIMADLMGRSEFLHLPYLVRLASLENHPYREEAHVELMNAIGDDYGTNWLGWSDAVATHLEAHPAAIGGIEVMQ